MRNFKGIILVIVVVLILASFAACHSSCGKKSTDSSTSTNSAKQVKTKKGLIEKDGVYYYYVKGKKVTNTWETVDGEQYYFAESGEAQTTKGQIDSSYCYFNSRGQLTRKIDLNKKLIALTYDDGPSTYTPTILETLKENDSVATFFIVGSRLSEYHAAAREEAEIGCEIGNHTYMHTSLTGISKKKAITAVDRCNEAIREFTETDCKLLRPPGGATRPAAGKALGMPQILWSVDTEDWKTRDAQSIANAVLDTAEDGDIVLMHDLYSETAEAAKTVVPGLIKKGFQLVTVSELADCKGVELVAGEAYYSFR